MKTLITRISSDLLDEALNTCIHTLTRNGSFLIIYNLQATIILKELHKDMKQTSQVRVHNFGA